MEFADWVCSIEDAISSSITNCSPRNWNDEDYITREWINAIRKTKKFISMTGWPRPFHLAWDAFKADGTLEESHGDVAFLVKQTFPNDRELVGVAFLEAKRIYDSGRFDKLDWNQLKKHAANSSSNRLLLYDNSDVSLSWPLQCPAMFPLPRMHAFFDEWYRYAEKYIGRFTTRASVCHPQHAIAYGEKTRELHKLAMPLSHQVCLRYFLGQDLDYNPHLVTEVSSGVAGGVDYLVVAHVRYGEGGEASIQSVDYNRKSYGAPEANGSTQSEE
jgi:hypothetical protein